MTRRHRKAITSWEDVVRKDTSQILGIKDGGDEQQTEKNGERRLLREVRAQTGL